MFGNNSPAEERSLGSPTGEQCTNYNTCGNPAIQRVDGAPVCGSCNVHFGSQDSGRPYMIVSRR
jgi:hypothetical protein